jgi:hypothetical protein
MTRDRAIQLRDAALTRVRQSGTWQLERSLNLNLLTYRGDGLMITYRTPFQRPREKADARTYTAALLQQQRRGDDLPYELEVWRDGTLFKLLVIKWADDGAVEIVGYQHRLESTIRYDHHLPS